VWRLSGAAVSKRVFVLAVALGYGTMNKPHFVALVGLVEIFYLRELRHGSGRRLWVALAGGAVLPFALLMLHSSESASALFTRAFAYHLSDSYETFSRPWAELLRSRRNLTLLSLTAGMLGLLVTAWRRKCLAPRNALLVGLLAIAAYLVFLQQQKLFRYHAIPFMAIAFVSSAMVTWKLAATVRHGLLRRGVECTVLAFALFQIGSGVYGLWDVVTSETRARVAAALPFLDELERARLITVFSPSVEGRLFAFSFGHDFEIMRPWSSHYTLGGLLGVRDRAERERRVRAYFAPIAERIRDEAPDLVAFSPMDQSLPHGTLHDVLVDRYGLFPSEKYSQRKRFANGWVVYRRAGAE
jgi:uncharacterized membrane protein (GlpM family)